jgi:LacI family transcriptional regulator, galactose operon repressor
MASVMIDHDLRAPGAVSAATSGRDPASQRFALGMVFTAAGGPYFSDLIDGFEVEAERAGVGLVVISTHHIAALDDIVWELASRVGGFAILREALPEPVILRLAARGVPVVLMASAPLGEIPAVRADNFGPTLALTRHLIEHHHYAPLQFFGSPGDSPDVGERWEAFREAHRHCGRKPPSQPIEAVLNQADGLRHAQELIQSGRLPRALVCANDELALGALSAARMHGIRVPEELAVTGWDNIPMSDLVSPTLTTVHQPIEELGAVAARSLLARIAGRPVARETVLPTTTIYRGTCGCGDHG